MILTPFSVKMFLSGKEIAIKIKETGLEVWLKQ
jgi:hypothetical protein